MEEMKKKRLDGGECGGNAVLLFWGQSSWGGVKN
jgi:hypothetical protein